MALNQPITDWNGQVVWLVGASSGIGRATASLLHARGAKVVISARSAEAVALFETEHSDSVGIALDVQDRAALHAAAMVIEARFGRIDLAFFCAGTYDAMRATAFDLDIATRHIQVNYLGALNVIDAVLPLFLKQGHGHLSFVSSVAGYRGLPNSLAYGPSKAALNNLAEVLYLDLKERGIAVSLICPGFVETKLTSVNDFKMPGLIKPDEAARQILKGWARGSFEIDFPKRFTWAMKFVSHLGPSLYFRVVRRITGL